MEKGGEIGAEEQGRPRRSYCIVNYRFSEKEIPDWSAACQSVNKHLSPSPFPPPPPLPRKKKKKHLSPKGVQFSLWLKLSYRVTNRLHSSSQMEIEVFKEAYKRFTA